MFLGWNLKTILPYFKSAPWNLSNCKILEQEYLYLGPEIPDLVILKLEFENKIGIFEISTLEFVYIQNLAKKQRCLNFRPKMPYLGVFDKKCPIWAFLRKNCKSTIDIFEISTLKFVYLQNFMKNLLTDFRFYKKPIHL